MMTHPTPGPWVIERAHRDQEGTIHLAIHTRDKLPEHPHSPRYIAWLCGTLRHATWQQAGLRLSVCPTCQRSYLHGREVGVDVRDDPQIEADARLLAAAPDLLAACLAVLEEDTAPDGGFLADSRRLLAAAVHKAMGEEDE